MKQSAARKRLPPDLSQLTGDAWRLRQRVMQRVLTAAHEVSYGELMASNAALCWRIAGHHGQSYLNHLLDALIEEARERRYRVTAPRPPM